MKKEIVGILVCTLLIIILLPITASTNENYGDPPLYEATVDDIHDGESSAGNNKGFWFGYNKPDPFLSFGFSLGSTWDATIWLGWEECYDFNYQWLTKVRFYTPNVTDLDGDVIIDYYKDFPDLKIFTCSVTPFTVSGEGWHIINIPDRLIYSVETTSITVRLQTPDHHNASTQVICFDSGPAVDGKGDWYNLNYGVPSSWYELQDLGFLWDGNWLIEGYISPIPDPTINIDDIYGGFKDPIPHVPWPLLHHYDLSDHIRPLTVNIILQNIAETEINNVTWSFEFDGNIKTIGENNGMIDTMSSGERVIVSSGIVVGITDYFMFPKGIVTFTASTQLGEPIVKERNLSVLGLLMNTYE